MSANSKGPAKAPVSLEALFLGPQSENQEFFRSMLGFLIEEHVHWRRDFHPKDHPLLTPKEMRTPEFLATVDRMREVLLDLSARLKSTSTPWFSTRYLGHMNSDTLMVSNLAEMAALLYNPNNVTFESSMATSPMEIECGQDFARLMGYDPRTAWGHITSDGTIANYEGLWLARNLKSFPAAAAEVAPALVEDRDPWVLANLSVDRSLDLLDAAKRSNQLSEILRASARGAGAGRFPLGKLLVSSTRHYSWEKAADLLGIGVEQVVRIPVTDRFRMDLDQFQATVDRLVREKTPILGAVGVVGTTEEGAIDEIDGLVRIRDQYAGKGVSFYLHVDAAYGGYGRALFLDSQGRFLPYEKLRDAGGAGSSPSGGGHAVPSREVWAAYRAMSAADSITVDPHKMGYVPYSAGGIAIRDRRLRLRPGEPPRPQPRECDPRGVESRGDRRLGLGGPPGPSAQPRRVRPDHRADDRRDRPLHPDPPVDARVLRRRGTDHLRAAARDSGLQHRLHGVQLPGERGLGPDEPAQRGDLPRLLLRSRSALQRQMDPLPHRTRSGHLR